MSLKIGRKGRLYIAEEVDYGVTPALLPTHAMRHISAQFAYDPFNRVTSPERKLSPGPVNRFDRRTTASLTTLEALIRPSGTLNTLPECATVLKAAFGDISNVTLATTLTGVPTQSTGSVVDGTGLAVGLPILITTGGKSYVRIITGIENGTDLTWAPKLPSAPEADDPVNGCIAFKLTTDLGLSLSIAYYLDGFTRLLTGVGIDQLTLTFDGTEEPRFNASGPARTQITPAPQQPFGFTEVGGNPPTGMVGSLLIGDTEYLHTSLEAQITNGLQVRNSEANNGGLASEVYRAGRREITLSLEAFAEDEETLYDVAEAGAITSVLRQVGTSKGNIVALWAPRAEFKVPTTTDEEEAVSWTFEATCLETHDAANDELMLVIA